MAIDAAHVARVLGGERTLGRRVKSLDDLRRLVEHGLPVRALATMALRVAEPALRYRVVPKATLHRRRRFLNLEESERLERLARVTAVAEDVFEDDDAAHEFLRGAQPQLGGATPLELARTELGARQVEELLMKMEYALPA